MLNGKKLSGENFCGLIQCYNEAINNGSIPNIESSWFTLKKHYKLLLERRQTENNTAIAFDLDFSYKKLNFINFKIIF